MFAYVVCMAIGIGTFTISAITFAKNPNWVSGLGVYLGTITFILNLVIFLGVPAPGDLS